MNNPVANSCADWLKNMLALRKLTQPDGRLLYEYQLNEPEFTRLQALLTQIPVRLRSRARHWEACTLIAGAEWYRRYYDTGDSWSWEPLEQGLSLDLSQPERARVIEQGCRYWQRPVRTNTVGRSLLGTVFVEGGLPLPLLTRQDSRFSLVLRHCLSRYELCQSNQMPLADAIRAQTQRYMAQVFQEDDSVELIERIVNQLMALAVRFELENTQDPAAVLDKKSPHWRRTFPLPLDKESGARLLNQWLCEASNENSRRKSATHKEKCQHLFEIETGALQTRLTLPKNQKIPVDPRLSGTNRVDINLYEGAVLRRTLGTVYAVREAHHWNVPLRNQTLQLYRQAPGEALSLQFSMAGCVIQRQPLDGSELPAGQTVLGFRQQDDEWVYINRASFRSRAVPILLLLPEEAHLSASTSAQLHAPESATLACGINVKPLIITAAVEILDGEDRYRICPGADHNSESDLILRGNLLPWPSSPQHVYLGRPQLPAGETGLALQIGRQPCPDRYLQPEMFGPQMLSLRNADGDVVLRQRGAILPEDLRIELEPAVGELSARIIVHTRSNCLYQINDKGLSFSRQRFDDHVVLHLKANTEQPLPAEFTLSLSANLVCEPINIRLPFPLTGAQLFDRNGRLIRGDFGFDQLLGCRLYLSTAGRKEQFMVNVSCISGDSGLPDLTLYYQVDRQPQVIELYSLRHQLEELFQLRPELDTHLRITITCSQREQHFRIWRYQSRLELKPLNLLAMDNPIEGIKASLIQLSDPARRLADLNEQRSEGAGTGIFELPAHCERNGPWLVVPGQDSTCTFRAVLVSGEPRQLEPGEQISSLHRATECYHPRQCPGSIRSVLTQMARNPEHSGWQYLQQLYSHYGHLPMSTFQVWKDLAGDPAVLAMMMFAMADISGLMHALERAFPIIWEAIPLQQWQQARRCYMEHYRQQQVPEEVLIIMAERRVNLITTSIPALKELSAVLNEQPAGPDLLPLLADGWYQGLLQQHAEHQWPEGLSHTLPVILDQPAFTGLLRFFPLRNRFQSSVVLLPLFMALVATGKLQLEQLGPDLAAIAYRIRRIRDFDHDWYIPLFSALVTHLLQHKD